jgi:hypothetical protein
MKPLVIALALLPLVDGVAQRHAPGSADAGLPRADVVWAPYHADPAHALNRLFRRTFLAELAPAVVGSALPRETTGELAEGWMLAWRDGTQDDSRLFGGDGRQLPRESFTAEEAQGVAADLAALTDADVAALRATPALAVLFQHDLLRTVQRLEDVGTNAELVPLLLAAARRVALPRATLATLPDLLERAPSRETPAHAAYAQRAAGFHELLRRSTRLFDASRSLLWSRLHLAHPGGRDATVQLVTAAFNGEPIETPIGTRALLVQGIVALDDAGEPVATPLAVDVRLQVLTNRDGLAATNPTSSRDGVDFVMLQLEREAARRALASADAPAPYRVVADDDQDLFRDYGTLKHTTYRAQCALCHRTTRTPEPELGGFPVLRKSAQPRLAESGTERLRLAESQVREWLASLSDE